MPNYTKKPPVEVAPDQVIAALTNKIDQLNTQRESIDQQIATVRESIKIVKAQRGVSASMQMILEVTRELGRETRKASKNLGKLSPHEIPALTPDSKPQAIIGISIAANGHAMTLAEISNYARLKGVKTYSAQSHLRSAAEGLIKKGAVLRVGMDKYALPAMGQDKLAVAQHAANKNGHLAVAGKKIGPATVIVLQAAGRALTNQEITDALIANGYDRKVKRESVGTILREDHAKFGIKAGEPDGRLNTWELDPNAKPIESARPGLEVTREKAREFIAKHPNASTTAIAEAIGVKPTDYFRTKVLRPIAQIELHKHADSTWSLPV
jgi:hypothetical protein